MSSDVRDTIKIFLKYKSYDALNDYISKHEPIDFCHIQGLTFPSNVIITRVQSKTSINMHELLAFPHILDVGYTNIHINDTTSFFQQVKVLAKCQRGHFIFDSSKLMHLYLRYWLFILLDRPIVRYKYDWVIISPNNIIHIRLSHFWMLNASNIPYNFLQKLEKQYYQIYNNVPAQIIKLDESAISFLKDIYGSSASESIRSLKYGVMDRSLFDTIISEHIRIHSADSPSIRKWAANYNIKFGRIASSPSLTQTLHYISTASPDMIWKSPIYLQDLKNESDLLLSMVESYEHKNKYQTSIQSRLDDTSVCHELFSRRMGNSFRK